MRRRSSFYRLFGFLSVLVLSLLAVPTNAWAQVPDFGLKVIDLGFVAGGFLLRVLAYFNGFSLTGKLLAVVVGGFCASLLALILRSLRPRKRIIFIH